MCNNALPAPPVKYSVYIMLLIFLFSFGKKNCGEFNKKSWLELSAF